MSVDTYKGESVGKKLARNRLWQTVVQRLGPDRAASSSYVVLASREGGDISVLKSYSIPDKRVIAVDRCAEAAAACRSKWPDANVVVGDVVDSVSKRTDVLFLDFCAPLCAETLATVRLCLDRMPLGAFFAVAFLKGRESSAPLSMAKPGVVNRRERRAMRSRLASSTRIGSTFADALIGDGTTSARASLAEPGGRFLPVVLATPPGKVCWFLASYTYQSDTAHARGVPMQISLFELTSCKRLDQFRSKRVPVDIAHCESDPLELREKAVELADRYDVRRAALALALPTSTVAAWKAHATRGTYAKEGA